MVQDKFPIMTGRELDRKLTQIFKGKEKSFIRDILECIRDEFNEFQQSCVEVESLVDYDNNFGISLDYLGSNYNENREGDPDKQYRDRIKALALASGSLGDDNTIIKGISAYMKLDYKQVKTSVIGIRKIDLEFPGLVTLSKVDGYIRKVKACGIRYQMTVKLDIENKINYFGTSYLHVDNEIKSDWR